MECLVQWFPFVTQYNLIEVKNVGAKHNVFFKRRRSLQKTRSFLSTVMKSLHSVQPLTEVSASRVQAVFMKFVSKEAQNSNIVGALLNSTQQPNRVFVTSFCSRDFVQMASEKPLNFHSGLWLHSFIVIFLGHFCPRGKGAMRLSLCEAPTRETRSDHNTGNYVPYSFR